MRSLSARMLLAALGTLVVSFIAFVIVFFVQSAPQIDRIIRQFQTIQLEEAVAALKRGGPTDAAEYVTRLDLIERRSCTAALSARRIASATTSR